MKVFLFNLRNSLDHLDDWNDCVWMTLVESGSAQKSKYMIMKAIQVGYVHVQLEVM